MNEDAIDFVLAAWQEAGRWRLERLPKRSAASAVRLCESLNAQESDGGVLGFVSVAEDFFVLVRVVGNQSRFLLSDIGAAADWPLAAQVVSSLGIPMPSDEDLEELTPAGDLTIVAEWGMSAAELSMLSEDLDLYPDEVLGSIAARLGFGDQFELALDQVRV